MLQVDVVNVKTWLIEEIYCNCGTWNDDIPSCNNDIHIPTFPTMIAKWQTWNVPQRGE